MNRLIMKTGYWLMVLLCLLMTPKTVTIETSEGNNFRQVSSSSDCDRLGHCDILIFECTVVGGLATVWRGTAFSCENSNNEIVLLHSRFVNRTIGTCNSGSIVAMGQDVTLGNDTYYTSQISITITFDVIGKNIECVHDDHENTNTTATVGSFTIPPITALPNGLRISHIDIGLIQLTFSWFGSPVASDFTEFNYLYNILASNCGSCPTTTNYTTVTCTDVPTNGSTCMLAVQTVVCTEFKDTLSGCTIGNSSESIRIKILNTRRSHNMIGDLTTDTMLIGSIVFLVASLTACTAVSFLVIATLLTKNRARIKSGFNGLCLRNGTSSTAAHGMEGMYDDVKNPSHSIRLSTISTRHNVAYGQKQAVSTAAAVPEINNNPAYNIIV